MIRLVTIGGTGDAYMVCALYDAFRRHHGLAEVEVCGKSKYAAIADLFRVPYVSDDEIVREAESSLEMQQTYENILLAPNTTFYVHPCFLRSEIRVDKLTTKPEASQADMYRMILRVPLDTPLAIPEVPAYEQERDSVLLIPEAVSWPNTQPKFWSMLETALRGIGRSVTRNDPAWSLKELFDRCGRAEWVIGPQCGVMSILCTGRFPCRKTLASPILNDANKKLAFLSASTFPYAYVTKFSNADYDVEEFEVTDDNHEELVISIIAGANALRLRHHDPRPVLTITAPLSPGDFLDRLAVLTVKRNRFAAGPRRAAIEREYQRYVTIRNSLQFGPEVESLFARLLDVHGQAFDLLERMVPAALNDNMEGCDHVAAVRLNRDRVHLKQSVDAVCRGPYTEAKSYYDETK